LRQVTLLDPIDRLLLRHRLGAAGSGNERTIGLIGDSLSTSFHLSSCFSMLIRMRRGWKINWFMTLPASEEVAPSVLMRLSSLGTVTGFQHASVSAMVDSAKDRTLLDRLKGTYHFSHQVDEVLTGQFPDILLLWIGHNDVDWRWQADSLTHESLHELSDAFVQRYEAQLRRLLDGALASENRVAIIVFGLVNFESFFEARAKAEDMRSTDKSLFPHLEVAYRYFVSMKPEYRKGMIELAAIFNKKLEIICKRLDEQLPGANVRLVYSDAMSVTRMDSASFLNSADAWHVSTLGHSRLAARAYPVVYEQAKFLGWANHQATEPSPR